MKPAPISSRGGERKAALETYVLPELEMLVRVARSFTRNNEDAEDLVQETLLRAYRAIDRFDGRFPRSWLLTIMRNAWINQVRRKTPDVLIDREASLDRLSAREHQTASAEQTFLDNTVDTDIAQAFRSLPPKFGQVVELVDVDGLSYQEAADALGLPIGTVMSRLHRARRKMKLELERGGRMREAL